MRKRIGVGSSVLADWRHGQNSLRFILTDGNKWDFLEHNEMETGTHHIRVPEPLASRLRQRAIQQRRSAQQEGLIAVENHLSQRRAELKSGAKLPRRK